MLILHILSHINWVDVLIVILLFKISYIGFNRGLSNEIFPLIGMFCVLLISLHYYTKVGGFISGHSPLPNRFSCMIGFTALALTVRFVFNFFGKIVIEKNVSVEITSVYNRIGGLFSGAARSIIIIALVLTGLELTPIPYISNSVTKRSLTGKMFLRIGRRVHDKSFAFLGHKKR